MSDNYPDELPPIESPESYYWQRNDGKLLRFPNGGTRAEWQKIADESAENAEGLPED